MNSQKKLITSFSLDPDVIETLRLRARACDQSASSIVQELIDRFLEELVAEKLTG